MNKTEEIAKEFTDLNKEYEDLMQELEKGVNELGLKEEDESNLIEALRLTRKSSSLMAKKYILIKLELVEETIIRILNDESVSGTLDKLIEKEESLVFHEGISGAITLVEESMKEEAGQKTESNNKLLLTMGSLERQKKMLSRLKKEDVIAMLKDRMKDTEKGIAKVKEKYDFLFTKDTLN